MSENQLAPSWLKSPGDPNGLADGVWPTNAARSIDGALTISGVSAPELANEFGTPLYVLDEGQVRSRANQFKTEFAKAFAEIGSEVTVYYAGKAFLCSEIAKWVVEEGINIDVSTAGELAVALAAGIDPNRLGLHGNNKSEHEIETAVRAGVGTIVIDHPDEIALIQAIAKDCQKVQPVRLRVRIGVHSDTHEYLATAHEDQKFGVSIDEVPGLVAMIRQATNLEFLGLHSHIGSQILTVDGFVEAIARLLRLHKSLLAGGPVPELNLGGGFGIRYLSIDPELKISETATAFAKAVAAGCLDLGIEVPKIAIEPGRAIVGSAGVTLYRVGAIKEVRVEREAELLVRRYVAVDGGMSDNLRPALYGANYTARIANRVSTAAPVLCRVVGKHCETGDIVVPDEYLPADVSRGDLLAVAATGAYCWSLSSNYNYLGRAPVIAIRDGSARLIVRGETENDLLARDPGLTELREGKDQ